MSIRVLDGHPNRWLLLPRETSWLSTKTCSNGFIRKFLNFNRIKADFDKHTVTDICQTPRDAAQTLNH